MSANELLRKNATSIAIVVALIAIVWGLVKTFMPSSEDKLIKVLEGQIARREECIKLLAKEQETLAGKISSLRNDNDRMKENLNGILASIKSTQEKKRADSTRIYLMGIDSLFKEIAVYANSVARRGRDLADRSNPCAGL
jgi:hypothetical protein